MLRYNNCSPEHKQNHDDWAVLAIAARFHLSVSAARVVAELAGLGSNDDRATASGGRAK